MRRIRNIGYLLGIGIWIVAVFSSCRSDFVRVTGLDDSDLVFFRRKQMRNDSLIGISNRFTLMNNAFVHARLKKNKLMKMKGNSLFHFDWIDPEGNTFYIKEVSVLNDSVPIESAISLNPEVRIPGGYTLRVYYFRELLLEKRFEVLPEYIPDSSAILDKSIQLFIKSYKKNKQLEIHDSTIRLMKKTWLEAVIPTPVLEDNDRELLYSIDWKDRFGNIHSRKRFEGEKIDSVLRSLFSLSPVKSREGRYTVEVYLFDKLMSKRDFILAPPHDVSKVNLRLSFCENYAKKTGKRSGVRKKFYLGEKNKVIACIDLDNCMVFGKTDWDVKLKWKDGRGNTIYTKTYDFIPSGKRKFLMSSISLPPGKRQTGTYTVQVLLFNEILGESTFEILPQIRLDKVKTDIVLYKKKSKKSGKIIGEGDHFIIGKKNKVRALINLSGLNSTGMKNIKYRLEWISPNGKTFYKKENTLPLQADSLVIRSGIRISPEKRIPGLYKLKVYLYGQLVREDRFVVE